MPTVFALHDHVMTTRAGITLVEVVAVLTLAGLLGTIVGRSWMLSPLGHDAEALAASIRVVRLQTVLLGRPNECLSSGPGWYAATLAWPPRGLTFTPDGLPRTCDGGGVGNTTILLEHRGRQAAVIVSSLGRVRWEMR